jgi:hypothetical protein
MPPLKAIIYRGGMRGFDYRRLGLRNMSRKVVAHFMNLATIQERCVSIFWTLSGELATWLLARQLLKRLVRLERFMRLNFYQTAQQLPAV